MTPRGRIAKHDHPGPLAISVRQPWAWAIVWGGKFIENRGWDTPYRGELFIHASAQMQLQEYLAARSWMLEYRLIDPITFPKRDELQFGAIIGRTRLMDIKESPRAAAERTKQIHSRRLKKWEMPGGYSWLLGQREQTPIVKCLGAQKLWIPPPEVLDVLRRTSA